MSVERQVAEDMLQAVEMAGGKGKLRPGVTGRYMASIGSLPDVERFARACRHLGIKGRLTYSAGTGWSVEA